MIELRPWSRQLNERRKVLHSYKIKGCYIKIMWDCPYRNIPYWQNAWDHFPKTIYSNLWIPKLALEILQQPQHATSHQTLTFSLLTLHSPQLPDSRRGLGFRPWTPLNCRYQLTWQLPPNWWDRRVSR